MIDCLIYINQYHTLLNLLEQVYSIACVLHSFFLPTYFFLLYFELSSLIIKYKSVSNTFYGGKLAGQWTIDCEHCTSTVDVSCSSQCSIRAGTRGNQTSDSFYQIIVGLDSKQISEITKGDWSVGFETKVWVLMCLCDIASFPVNKKKVKRICNKFNNTMQEYNIRGW